MAKECYYLQLGKVQHGVFQQGNLCSIIPYLGPTIDKRKATIGWKTVDYDDSKWDGSSSSKK